MFADRAEIYIRSGKGGDGSVSFRRELFVAAGGPNGGDGGRGGDIIFEVDEGLNTLADFRFIRKYVAEDGQNGGTNRCSGKNGADKILKVPEGTVLIEKESGKVITDMSHENRREVILHGGRGGKGNQHYATATMQVPKYAQPGQDGQELNVILELKVIADVGLVGYPNVGKSTFLSRVTNAKPKIANYHFTTLNPNLGVAKTSDNRSFVVADLPGLIEGASNGEGLGDKFLKHASRCRVIAYVLDMSSFSNRNIIEEYEILKKELKNYSEKLFNKKHIIIANKMDDVNSKEKLEELKKAYKDEIIIETSAITKEGLDELKYKLKEMLDNTSSEELYDNEEMESYVLYEFKKELPYNIIKENDHSFIISGEKLESLLKKTKFNGEEAELRFARKLM